MLEATLVQGQKDMYKRKHALSVVQPTGPASNPTVAPVRLARQDQGRNDATKTASRPLAVLLCCTRASLELTS